MDPNLAKRGVELAELIEKYEQDVFDLDPGERKRMEKSAVTRIEFKTDGGQTVHFLRADSVILDQIQTIVRREYTSRILKFKNELDAL